MIRFLIKLAAVTIALAMASAQRVGYAQEEEEAEDAPNARPQVGAAVMKMQQANIDQQVDQWVFNRFGGAAPARTKLESAPPLADRRSRPRVHLDRSPEAEAQARRPGGRQAVL